MGIGYTIDTPVKVAQYGISSVISLVDDMLMEKMREFYSKKMDLPFQEITDKIEDFRAKRISAYLNLIDTIVKAKFEEMKISLLEKGSELEKCLDLLPRTSALKEKFEHMKQHESIRDAITWLQQNLHAGSIDVNIMTKLDKENYFNNEKLPAEYNDAHAALRGFANSNLSSSVVLSAGMSPKLYSYIEKFNDFFPDSSGNLKKKITLKVSDYRSALVQGKFLAKKGLWVSEYRVESGLNCGGHAFATQGFLMGPILEEFKNNREVLIQSTFEILSQTLKAKGLECPQTHPEIKITAQGGVGTADEHTFLLNYYDLDSIGWGSPFLLVSEASSIDENTMQQLCDAKEDDLFLSNISPLGVPFNSLRGNTKDVEKQKNIDAGKPGFPCTKRFLVSNTEYTDKPICTASKQYQKLKLATLESSNLTPEALFQQKSSLQAKACICVGLGTSTLLINNISTGFDGDGVSICPGPNLAYFSEKATLSEMVGHIYGKNNLIKRTDRPHMFLKELSMYIDYLDVKLKEAVVEMNEKTLDYLNVFQKNLLEGVEYYKNLFNNHISPDQIEYIIMQLEKFENKILQLEFSKA